MSDEANEAGSNTDTGGEGSQNDGAASTETKTIMTEEQPKDGEGEGAGDDQGEGEGSPAAKGDEGAGDGEGSGEPEGEGEGEGDDKGEGQDEVPETYEFKMPEGMQVDEVLSEAVTPVFKELGLTQDKADKLVEAFAEYRVKEAEAADAAFEQQVDDWKSELESDPDFGGDDFEKNAGQVFEFIQKTVPDNVKEGVMSFLRDTGAGNHPGLVKYFHSLSVQFPVGEDQPGGGGVHHEKKTREERMYPND